MESEILAVADYAVEQPGVSGYLCVDNKGLCIASKGDACEQMSGIIHELANLASKIESPSLTQLGQGDSNEKKQPPVIRVDLERYKMVIQSRDTITTALISPQK